MPNFSSNECNLTETSTPRQFVSNINSKEFNSSSRILKDNNSVSFGLSSHTDCNIVAEEINIRSNTNFFDSYTQEINKQTEQNSGPSNSMSPNLNRFETRLESTPPPRNESRNSSCISSEIVSPSVSSDYTPSSHIQLLEP